jgi:hypothetical protein
MIFRTDVRDGKLRERLGLLLGISRGIKAVANCAMKRTNRPAERAGVNNGFLVRSQQKFAIRVNVTSDSRSWTGDVLSLANCRNIYCRLFKNYLRMW